MRLLPLLFVGLVAAAPAWGEGRASIAAAETAAAGWLRLLDDGQYDASWAQAADLFKQRVTQDEWQARVKTVRESLGKFVARSRTTAASMRTLPGVPDGDYVVLRFATTFSKKQNAMETVTEMRGADGSWRMVGYFLQ